MLRPVRTIRVTTEAELDAALGSADQVIVEGDGRLLSYAASKASTDPDNSVSVEIGEHSIVVGSANIECSPISTETLLSGSVDALEAA